MTLLKNIGVNKKGLNLEKLQNDFVSLSEFSPVWQESDIENRWH